MPEPAHHRRAAAARRSSLTSSSCACRRSMLTAHSAPSSSVVDVQQPCPKSPMSHRRMALATHPKSRAPMDPLASHLDLLAMEQSRRREIYNRERGQTVAAKTLAAIWNLSCHEDHVTRPPSLCHPKPITAPWRRPSTEPHMTLSHNSETCFHQYSLVFY
jgi:hypothetical protein